MPDNITAQISATVVHRKAQSVCCAAPLDRVAPGTEEFTCRQCKQPAELVHAEPRHIPASGSAVIPVPEGDV